MKHVKWIAPLALAFALSPAHAQTWKKLNIGIARDVSPNQIGVNIGTSSANFVQIGNIVGGAFLLPIERISGLYPYATGTAGTGANATATAFSASNQALWLSGNLTGTGAAPYSIISVADTADGSTAVPALAATWIAHNINTGAAKGSRFTLMPVLTKNVAIAGTDTSKKFYTPFFAQHYVKAGDGGSGTGPTYYGAHYGFSSLVQAQSGATYLDTIQGAEIDVAVQSGASTSIKNILLLASVNSDAVKGTTYDGMLAFGSDATTTAKWAYGVTFGWPRGPWAFDTSSTLIGSVAPGSGSRVANYGVDLSGVTFSTAAFKSTGFQVDGSGALTSVGVTSSGTVSSSGAAGGFVMYSRSGSGQTYQWYNSTGVNTTLYNGTRVVATFDNSNDGSFTVPGLITGTAYSASAPVTKTANYTVDSGSSKDSTIIFNGSGSLTVTLPTASSFTGRRLRLKTIAAQTVVSASSDVVPLAGGAAGTAILAATAGKWVDLDSDGTNWVITASN